MSVYVQEVAACVVAGGVQVVLPGGGRLHSRITLVLYRCSLRASPFRKNDGVRNFA